MTLISFIITKCIFSLVLPSRICCHSILKCISTATQFHLHHFLFISMLLWAGTSFMSLNAQDWMTNCIPGMVQPYLECSWICLHFINSIWWHMLHLWHSAQIISQQSIQQTHNYLFQAVANAYFHWCYCNEILHLCLNHKLQSITEAIPNFKGEQSLSS